MKPLVLFSTLLFVFAGTMPIWSSELENSLSTARVGQLKKNSHDSIGIIGGADPSASCLLYRKIIETCLSRCDCSHGEDFPEIVIINFPFSRLDDVQDAENNKAALCSQLQYSVDKLAEYPVSLLAIACNTLHTLLGDINLQQLNLIHIAQETLDEAERQGCSKLLVLATQTSVKRELYKRTSIDIVTPSEAEQVFVNQVIDRIEQNNVTEEDAQQLAALIAKMRNEMACDGVVLGCTELSVLNETYPSVFFRNNLGVVVLDSTSILAQSVVTKSFNERIMTGSGQTK